MSFASIVRHALLVEALQWLFEAVWDAAVPIMTSVNSETDPRRQMLISMLMTGSTDSAIADTLNINVRSVRRWISELMDELGVSTRLQLVRHWYGQTGCVATVRARGKHCHLFDGCVTRALIPKATPAVLRRTAGVARGGTPSGTSGKSSTRAVLVKPRSLAAQPPGTSGIPASFRKIWCSLCSMQTLSDTISLADMSWPGISL